MTLRQAIMCIKKHNEIHSKKERNAIFITEALNMAVSALEKQIPKKPIYFHEEYDRHEWRRNPDGSIDEDAWEYDIHNGVICEKCGKQYCVDCDSDYNDKDEKCIIDKYVCPTCDEKTVQGYKLCHNCGQLFDWSDYR